MNLPPHQVPLKFPPGWGGPDSTPDASKSPRLGSRPIPMATELTFPGEVVFKKPGVEPPVFVAGSFNEWQPIEMAYTVHHEDGKTVYRFMHTFQAKLGQYQYKFRLGNGAWWLCDETAPQTADAAGNSNNVLTVTKRTASQSPKTPQSTFSNLDNIEPPAQAWPPSRTDSDMDTSLDPDYTKYPEMSRRSSSHSSHVNSNNSTRRGSAEAPKKKGNGHLMGWDGANDLEDDVPKEANASKAVIDSSNVPEEAIVDSSADEQTNETDNNESAPLSKLANGDSKAKTTVSEQEDPISYTSFPADGSNETKASWFVRYCLCGGGRNVTVLVVTVAMIPVLAWILQS